MEIRYRLFFDRNNNEPFGIAYNGYEEVPPNNDITCLIYGRMNITHVLKKSIDNVSIDDVRELGFDETYFFGATITADIPETGYTPYDIVEEQQDLYYKRKTA